jgi:hypothetical protein
MSREINQFAAVIQSAESHLRSTEKSASQIHFRINALTQDIIGDFLNYYFHRSLIIWPDTERGRDESRNLIATAEKKIETLVSQQANTKRKLSALYNSLITVGQKLHAPIGGGKTTQPPIHLLWKFAIHGNLISASFDELITLSKLMDYTINNEDNSYLQAADQSKLNAIDPLIPICLSSLDESCKDKVNDFLFDYIVLTQILALSTSTSADPS